MTESEIPTPAGDELADDAQAAAMKQKMQHDVAAWSASRAEAPTQPLVATRAAPRPNGRVGVTKAPQEPVVPARTPSAAPSVATVRKPFAMKYDGMPAARYAAERFTRGAR